MPQSMRTTHDYDDVPLPRLGVAVAGWGNPYVWEPRKRDQRGTQTEFAEPIVDYNRGKMSPILQHELEVIRVL